MELAGQVVIVSLVSRSGRSVVSRESHCSGCARRREVKDEMPRVTMISATSITRD